MEDKKVLEFINKNYERAYKDYVKTQKRKNRKENIKLAIITILFITCLFWLFVSVQNDNKKAMETCLSKGNSYNYCYYEVSK